MPHSSAKRRGQAPDLAEPVVLTHGRHGVTGEGQLAPATLCAWQSVNFMSCTPAAEVESLCNQIHKDMVQVGMVDALRSSWQTRLYRQSLVPLRLSSTGCVAPVTCLARLQSFSTAV